MESPQARKTRMKAALARFFAGQPEADDLAVERMGLGEFMVELGYADAAHAREELRDWHPRGHQPRPASDQSPVDPPSDKARSADPAVPPLSTPLQPPPEAPQAPVPEPPPEPAEDDNSIP